jgi:hypothetical protein
VEARREHAGELLVVVGSGVCCVLLMELLVLIRGRGGRSHSYCHDTRTAAMRVSKEMKMLLRYLSDETSNSY